jgi:hypothetical protein
MPERRVAFGPFVLDREVGTLLRDGVPVPVGYRGLLLLSALISRPGEVLTKSDLIDAAWQGAVVEETNLSVVPPYLFLAASAALGGNQAAAEKAMARVRMLDPGLRLSNLHRFYPARRQEDIDRLREGLRKAGLPDS